ncbi:hypothetical protein CkaCkLH20_11683 [Colletotrichum karsti]|uniref:DUF7708 domain-containing protein n=1 Tax=Colletotrichum karsti TaxID=1095194 RepID=A0A9P6HUS3_9PEZI|nr:uncharacterized protein CkaCkLH20_11683 [Colletotrichum karsti]KAF9870784.1 hypothetical protein CkaCkLH20_11683 [Colletotrichum karsti]
MTLAIRRQTLAQADKARQTVATEFVGEFSGIIEIVKGADQGYGGAGYTALSVLLAVAVNTKRKDDLVSEALNNLKREYSRMVLLSEIYHTPMMSMYITTVFKLGIEFMQEAISHYSRPTWRRLWDAVVRPPFLLNRKVSEISAAMIQIEKERDTLLTKSVHVLHIKMDHMTENVAQLQGDLDQIHTNDEKKRLVTLRSELLRYLIQPNKTVDDYSRLLNGAFDLPPGLPRFGADQVMQEKAYAAWKNSRSNCMLVVTAIEVASALKREASIDAAYGGVAVVDLYCQKADFMTDKDQATSLGVVVSLLFQLLEANPSTLRDVSKFDSLRQRIAEVDGAGSRGLDVAFGLLSDILGHFDLVYIVLDRVDRIRGDFLRIMLTRLMVSRRNGPKIRAFCVACSNKEGMRKSLKELEEEMDDKNLILFQKDQSRF